MQNGFKQIAVIERRYHDSLEQVYILQFEHHHKIDKEKKNDLSFERVRYAIFWKRNHF